MMVYKIENNQQIEFFILKTLCYIIKNYFMK